MADQILRAEENGVSADLGVKDSQGKINLATYDYDANINLNNIITSLNDLLIELQGKLDSGGIVGLDAASLSALENISATVSNWPLTFPDQHSQPVTDTQLRATPVDVTVSNPTTDPETGLAKDATLQDVKRAITDYEVRMEYDGSDNLIYAGKASQGAATSATSWTIQKLEYTSGNLTRVQVLTGAWDNRAALGWT